MKVLTYIKSNNLNAGPKAEKDIINIIKNNYSNAKFNTIFYSNKYLLYIKKLFLIFKNIFAKEILVLQYPITHSILIKLLPSKRTIIFIHDLNSIRDNLNKKNLKEIDNLKHFKYIVCHNNCMKKYLIDQGIADKNLYTLQMFDYLCEEKENADKTNQTIFNNQIIYAGNMKKSPFIYQLDEKKIKYPINLYGQGIEENVNKKVLYKGLFQPESLPTEWNGAVGLVWDGNYDESDEYEGFKNYTRYNNPHKLSCYIAAGIPVIVWKKAATAGFVKEHNIGYTISSIYDINNIDFSDYKEKAKNAKMLSEKVRKGSFTTSILNKIISAINNK